MWVAVDHLGILNRSVWSSVHVIRSSGTGRTVYEPFGVRIDLVATEPPSAGGVSREPGLTFDVVSSDGSTRVALEGDLDLYSAQVIESCAAVIGELSRPRRLEVNLAGLQFCDVGGMRALVHLRDHAQSRGIEVRFTDAQPIVRRLFAACGVGGLLEAGPGTRT